MAGKTHLPEGFEKIDFAGRYKTSASPKGRIRCLAMGQLQAGHSVSEVAALVRQSRAAIHSWLGWLREPGGLERLAGFVRGRGRKRKLAGTSEAAAQAALLELSGRRQGGRMTGREAQRLLKERFGADYRRSGVYVVLARLKLVWITARSQHPQADPPAQADFKKTLRPKRAQPCPPPCDRSRWKCGSRTSTASGRRAR